MSFPRKPLSALPFMGIIISQDIDYAKLIKELEADFGEILFERPLIPLDWTEYYTSEMGEKLFRSWIFFKELIDPSEIVAIKHRSRVIEDKYSVGNNRRVNLDPGYVNAARVVLSTFKDFSHRVYMFDGVYAEVTMQFRGTDFRAEEWTFSDYIDEKNLPYFHKARKLYMELLRSNS